MKRYGSVIELRREKAEEYKQLHEAVWPDVLIAIQAANIRNYSIYLRELEEKLFLFSYFEYAGNDFDGDMRRMAANAAIQKWWAVCKPCHQPLAGRGADEWWANMEEVFHQD